MNPEHISRAITQIQEDYLRRKREIKNSISQSGMTDVLQQRVFDYSNFVRTLETIREAVLEMKEKNQQK